MRVSYPAVLEHGEDGGYGVWFPDLDGCVSGGDTAEEAARNAEDALAQHLEVMVEEGIAIPEPSDISAVEVSAAAVGRLLVSAETGGKAERINISFDAVLLSRADRYAKEAGFSRSGLVEAALRRFIDPRETAPAGQAVAQLADGIQEALASMKTLEKLWSGAAPDRNIGTVSSYQAPDRGGSARKTVAAPSVPYGSRLKKPKGAK